MTMTFGRTIWIRREREKKWENFVIMVFIVSLAFRFRSDEFLRVSVTFEKVNRQEKKKNMMTIMSNKKQIVFNCFATRKKRSIWQCQTQRNSGTLFNENILEHFWLMCHIEMCARAIENHSGNPLYSIVSLSTPESSLSMRKRCKIHEQ